MTARMAVLSLTSAGLVPALSQHTRTLSDIFPLREGVAGFLCFLPRSTNFFSLRLVCNTPAACRRGMFDQCGARARTPVVCACR